MPHVLKELMRHETIETTMKYYVGHSAQTIAETLWKSEPVHGLGNILGNSGHFTRSSNWRNSVAEPGFEPARGLHLTGF